MSISNKQVLLAQRPQGEVKETDFRIVEKELPALQAGEVLIKNLYLSLDPYMRGRMSEGRSYTAPMEVGQVMVGSTTGVVVESRSPKFSVNDQVLGYFGWQLYGISNGENLQKLEQHENIPASTRLGILGMTGITAWIGLIEIGQPKAGETVVVSAAAGAVGSVVGQLARARGCHVVGIAGGRAKCDYVVNELGFDACVDYKAGHLAEDLKAAAPNGVDVYFENVGGEILDTVLLQLNAHARVPVCGFVSQYNSPQHRPLQNVGIILASRIKIQGFIVGEHMENWLAAQKELTTLFASGQLKSQETISEGLESAPQAFMGMLKGANTGKQLVKLA